MGRQGQKCRGLSIGMKEATVSRLEETLAAVLECSVPREEREEPFPQDFLCS
jgi:hypothetical protein